MVSLWNSFFKEVIKFCLSVLLRKSLGNIESINREDLKMHSLFYSSPLDLCSPTPTTLRTSVLFVFLLCVREDEMSRINITPEITVILTGVLLEQV